MAHLHSVYDNDTHFSIDPASRVVTNTTGKTKLIQFDHNSERFTFDIPRLVEGHDMTLCDKIEVHYINVSANKNEQSADVYLVKDVQLSPDSEDVAIFSWLISANATKYAGTLNFLIRFSCLNGKEIEYAWNTAIHSSITVGNGMNNGETVITEYSDILEQWRQHLFEAIVQNQGNDETVVMSQKAVTDALACKVDKIFKHSITITDIVSADYSVHLTVQNTSATPYTDIWQLDDSESWEGTSYPVTGDIAIGDNVERIDVIAMDGVAWLVYTYGSTENMLDISNAEVTDVVAEV